MINGMLLGYIVIKKGIAMDLDKVKAMLEAPSPKNAKSLSKFLGHIQWHSCMIRYLADFQHLYMQQCTKNRLLRHLRRRRNLSDHSKSC